VLTRGWLKERTILKVEALYFFKKFKKQKKIASFTVDWLYFAFKKKVSIFLSFKTRSLPPPAPTVKEEDDQF